MRTKLLVTGAVLGALVAAVPAVAHETDASVTCDQTTFTYTEFPNAPQTANWRVTSDDQLVGTGTFAFQGGAPSAQTVHYSLSPGTHTVKAYTWWTANDGNVRSIDAPPAATAVVTCTAPTPPTQTVTPAFDAAPPPPAEETPPPATSSAPAPAVASPAPFVAAKKAKAVKKPHKVVHKPKAKKKPRIAAARAAKVVRRAPRLTG
jgi:hypothetical protein